MSQNQTDDVTITFSKVELAKLIEYMEYHTGYLNRQEDPELYALMDKLGWVPDGD